MGPGVATPRIGVAVSAGCGGVLDVDGLLERIGGGWSGDGAPAWERVAFETLLDSGKKGVRGYAALLVVLCEDEASSAVHRLNDLLSSTRKGCLVLAPPGSDPPVLEGVPVECYEASGGRVATMLETIVRRQPLIDSLAMESDIAQASLRGLESQMGEWQTEMRTAAQVQREFIPHKAPRHGAVSTGAVYRPAGYVSGDIYDVQMLDDRRMGFFIADAVGHGVPAALMTLVIARSLRLARGVGSGRVLIPPAEAMAKLNRDLCERETEQQRFATAVCGVIDVLTGETVLAGAGHPPPILWHRGEATRVETQGPLLGVFDGAAFDQAEFVMDPGDVLVMFSDGFETAFPDPGATGDGLKMPTMRYVEHLQAVCRGGAAIEDAVEVLDRALDTQAGSLHQPDDVTALVLAMGEPVGAASCEAVRSAA